MNIKEKWIASLRSGEFKQGKGGLKFNDEYCCLGVLCSISGMGQFDREELSCAYEYNGQSGMLYPPENLMKDLGLEIVFSQGRLAVLNDSGKTFSEIADYLEKHLVYDEATGKFVLEERGK